jgi:type III restriction enzyme
MKIKFKSLQYQTNAVKSVVECFSGQPPAKGLASYRIDPGSVKKGVSRSLDENQSGFKNNDLSISRHDLLTNIQKVQREQNLPVDASLVESKVCNINLDVEMETGTGKTYCYLKTMFDLNKAYGWSKFVIVVPSIAIREGVFKSVEITADDFLNSYGKKLRAFIYNSKQLHNLESFSSDSGINLMIINVQAFNATGKDNLRIYDELDDFQSRRPIDVIKANRPILILDEPQKMEGAKTLEGLSRFNPLMVIRYSATHKTKHNKIHRLDALDAYNQKLVKKISVRGISVRGLSGTNAYLYLESIEISKSKPPVARLELEIKQNNGIKRVLRKIGKGDNLFDMSQGLDQYKGFVVSDINANEDSITFTNGVVINSGEATGDVNEESLRRIQIREAIKAHFETEKNLHSQDVKVLSLFFIDEVAKYRIYEDGKELKGQYAQVFEEEYNNILNEVLTLEDTPYNKYLKGIATEKTHSGYFAIDKKTKRLVDPESKLVKDDETGQKQAVSDDADAYDLILKDKERLLGFAEPVRFIFSHSALREGWDNPNVFVICTLKHSDNTISRRQEVGRGLRLSVNQNGDRMDNLATVHQVNVLTVVASESYKDFVTALQRDISQTLSERPRIADEKYFTGKVIQTAEGVMEVTGAMAKQIYRYLVKNDFTDDKDKITEAYHQAKKEGKLPELPAELMPYFDEIINLVDSVYTNEALLIPEDGRNTKINPLNSNFNKKEFQALWGKINQKAIYKVDFDSKELIENAVKCLDKELRVTPLQYTIQKGMQVEETTLDEIRKGEGFKIEKTYTDNNAISVHSVVKYDLVGKVAEQVTLKRATVTTMLKGINLAVFNQYKTNPESFIAEASRLINEQKASMVIEKLTYNPIDETHDASIFTASQVKQDFSNSGSPLKNHIYDYVVTDSSIERKFVTELDTSDEVIVYAKLPSGFSIPTPVGNYNPDWAISFKQGAVKHIYFVAETKGAMSSMKLRTEESIKIKCARKFFDKLNATNASDVKYEVVTNYEKLMEIVK